LEFDEEISGQLADVRVPGCRKKHLT